MKTFKSEKIKHVEFHLEIDSPFFPFGEWDSLRGQERNFLKAAHFYSGLPSSIQLKNVKPPFLEDRLRCVRVRECLLMHFVSFYYFKGDIFGRSTIRKNEIVETNQRTFGNARNVPFCCYKIGIGNKIFPDKKQPVSYSMFHESKSGARNEPRYQRWVAALTHRKQSDTTHRFVTTISDSSSPVFSICSSRAGPGSLWAAERPVRQKPGMLRCRRTFVFVFTGEYLTGEYFQS